MPNFLSYLWKSAYHGKMSIKLAKKKHQSQEFSFIIHHLSLIWEIHTFKYLVLKTVQQESLFRSFLGLENRKKPEFYRTVWTVDC